MIDLSQLKEDFIKNNKNIEDAKQGFIIRDENISFHVMDAYSVEDHNDLNEKERFYLPFCSKEEIKNVQKLKNTEEYLLWLRLESIADSPRLTRVFRAKKQNKNNWSLTKYYQKYNHLFNEYLNNISKGKKRKLKAMTSGFAFVKEANAMCLKTEFGNLVLISEPLRYFLYYMNIVFFGHQLDLRSEDISASLAIAIRIMLGNESFDFDLDPRGDLPQSIHSEIQMVTEQQLLFIIGHEYSHHILGHLSDTYTNTIKSKDLFFSSYSKNNYKYYNYRYSHEYKADFFSIKNIKSEANIKSAILNGAFHILIYFDIIDSLLQTMALRPIASSTHPKPLDRLYKLRKAFNNKLGYPKTELDNIINFSDLLKNKINKDWLSYNIDTLEMYGSIYLPSYKNKLLKDRIDY